MPVTLRLRVEVEDDRLMVTLPGTTFHVIYRKTNDTPGLVQFAVQADRSTGISQADFLAREGGWLTIRRENSAGCLGQQRSPNRNGLGGREAPKTVSHLECRVGFSDRQHRCCRKTRPTVTVRKSTKAVKTFKSNVGIREAPDRGAEPGLPVPLRGNL